MYHTCMYLSFIRGFKLELCFVGTAPTPPQGDGQGFVHVHVVLRIYTVAINTRG